MIHSKHLSAVLARGVQRCPISHFFVCTEPAAGENNRRYMWTKEKTTVLSDLNSQTNISATSEGKTQMECRSLWGTFTLHHFLTTFQPSCTTGFHNVPVIRCTSEGGTPLWMCRYQTRVIHEDSTPSGTTGAARREFLCVLALHFSLTYTAFVK